MKDTDSLSHTTYNCKYHLVFAPKYRRLIIYGKLKKRYREDPADALRAQRSPIIGSRSVCRPHPYVGQHSAEIQRFASNGLFEGKEHTFNF